MNLRRLAGVRLHLSRVVRQGAQPLLREMSRVVSAARLSAACRKPSHSKPPSGNAVLLPVSVPELAA